MRSTSRAIARWAPIMIATTSTARHNEERTEGMHVSDAPNPTSASRFQTGAWCRVPEVLFTPRSSGNFNRARVWTRERGRVAQQPCASVPWRYGTLSSMTAPARTRPGRNEPCHCGSGRKYKLCCLEKDNAEAGAARAKIAAEAPAESAKAAPATPTRAPKPQTDQPWKTTTSRGFIPRSRTPRKVGGG